MHLTYWKKLTTFISIAAIILIQIAVFPVAYAVSVPNYMSYEGYLTDSSGNPIDDTLTSVEFKIYDADTGGTALWTESHSSVPVNDGYFSVQLGSETTLDLDFEEQYWLTVNVNSDGEMSPRQPINSVGYSYASDFTYGAYANDTEPGTPAGGMLYYDTDDGNIYLYDDQATAWVDLSAGTVYSAGNDLDLDSGTFDIEPILNFVSEIARGAGETLEISLGETAGDDLIVDSDTFVVESDNNRVGIGTIAPNEALEVNGNIRLSEGGYIDTGEISNYNLFIGDTSNSSQYGTLWIKSALSGTANGLRIYPRDEVSSIQHYAHLGYDGSQDYLVLGTEAYPDAITVKDSTGYVGVGTASPDRILHSNISDTTTNDVSYALRLTHDLSSGSAASSFGTGLEFELENASDSNVLAAALESIWTDATSGQENSSLIFKTTETDDDGLAERMRIDHEGALTTQGNITINNTGGELKIVDASGSYSGILKLTTLTGGQTYTFPDKTGTVAMTSDIVWTAQDGDTTTYTVDSADTLQFAEGTGIDIDFTGDDILTFSATGGSSLWESGTYAVYEDDDDVAVGTSGDETIENAGFSLSGDDFFVAGDAGVEGDVYTDGSFIAGNTLTLTDGSIDQSTGSLSLSLGGTSGDNFIVDTKSLVVDSNNHTVGFQTTLPYFNIDSLVDDSGNHGYGMRLHNLNTASGTGSGILFTNTTVQGGSSDYSSAIVGERTSSSQDLVFKPASSTSGSPTEQMRLEGSGELGLGVTSPDNLLDIAQEDSGTNNIDTLMEITRESTGTVTDGFGTGIDLRAESATGGSNATIGAMEAWWIDESGLDSAVKFMQGIAGGLIDSFSLREDGMVQVGPYNVSYEPTHVSGAGDLYVRDELEVADDIYLEDSIFHINDATTYLDFETNEFHIYANGSHQAEIDGKDFIINPDESALDFTVKGDNSSSVLHVDGDSDVVAIGGPVGTGVETDSSLHIQSKDSSASAIHFEEYAAGDGEDWQMGVDSAGHFSFYDSSGSLPVLFLEDDETNQNGQVGIGVNNPNSKLHVNSASGENPFRAQVSGSSKLIVNSNGGTAIGENVPPPTNGLYVLGDTNFDGDVGIGESSPSSALDVVTSSSSGYAAEFFNDGDDDEYWGIKVQTGRDNGWGTNYLARWFDGDGTDIGSINFSGGTVSYSSFTANHDVILPKKDNENGYEYGTLLCLDKATKDNQTPRQPAYEVQPCKKEYDNSIFGVYSGKYDDKENLHVAYVLGDGQVLVSNENGNIKMGDRITSSSQSGVGMKATEPGTILGIALENWNPSSTFTATLPDGKQAEVGLITVYYYPGTYYIGEGGVDKLKAEAKIKQNTGITIDKKFKDESFMTVDSKGNVGIGTDSPAYKLQVAGSIGANAFINNSSEEIKKDINYLQEEDYKEILSQLNETDIATYHYKTECLEEGGPCEDRLGLIAEYAPEQVLTADGKNVDLYKLAGFIFSAVKAQQNTLDSVIENAQEKFDTIKSSINNLDFGLRTVHSNTNEVSDIVKELEMSFTGLQEDYSLSKEAFKKLQEDYALQKENIRAQLALILEQIGDNGSLADSPIENFVATAIGNINGNFRNKKATLSNNGAGLARILAGSTEVRVNFDSLYEYMPIVTITPMNTMQPDLAYIVKDVDTAGFTIEINNGYENDIDFSWQVFGVNEGEMHISDGTKEDIFFIEGVCAVQPEEEFIGPCPEEGCEVVGDDDDDNDAEEVVEGDDDDDTEEVVEGDDDDDNDTEEVVEGDDDDNDNDSEAAPETTDSEEVQPEPEPEPEEVQPEPEPAPEPEPVSQNPQTLISRDPNSSDLSTTVISLSLASVPIGVAIGTIIGLALFSRRKKK